MQCFVYASLRKVDSYLWLAQRDAFDTLVEHDLAVERPVHGALVGDLHKPSALVLLLGELRFVMEVQLDEQRRLPVEDTEQVLEHLRTQGWHLQLPPQETLATANHPAYTHSPRDDRDE